MNDNDNLSQHHKAAPTFGPAQPNGGLFRKEWVSIITPFRNDEKVIATTIGSVLLQSYRNWEMILVDDGSTDNTAGIISHYAQSCPDRMHIVTRQGNIKRGISASRNLGYSHARGQYIAYLDAGDLWMSNKLLLEVTLLEKNPDVDAVVSPVRYFYTGPANKWTLDQDLSSLAEGRYSPAMLCDECLKNPSCPSAVLLRRQTAARLGWDAPFQQDTADYVFGIKLAALASVYITHQRTTYCRRYEQSFRQPLLCNTIDDQFWAWLTGFGHKFKNKPAVKNSLLAIAGEKMSLQTKRDYEQSLRTLANSQGSPLEDGVYWVNYKAQQWLEDNIAAGMNIFEYGSGGSTIRFLNKRCRLTSVEHDQAWYCKVMEKLTHLGMGQNHTYILQEPTRVAFNQQRYLSAFPKYAGYSFEKYVRAIEAYEDCSFDVIFVDGRSRVDCVRHAVSKLKPGGYLILDNAEREHYQAVYDILAGYTREDFYGFGPYGAIPWQTLVFTKPGTKMPYSKNLTQGQGRTDCFMIEKDNWNTYDFVAVKS